jgi:hypothetical protein
VLAQPAALENSHIETTGRESVPTSNHPSEICGADSGDNSCKPQKIETKIRNRSPLTQVRTLAKKMLSIEI